MRKLLKADEVFVEEGQLYEVFGEDEPIVTFNAGVVAKVGELVLYHDKVFPGHFVDEEGINRCAPSRRQAQELADRIRDAGMLIDPLHWS